MKKIDKKVILEGLKEVIRTSVLGFVYYLLTDGVFQSFLAWAFGAKLDPFVYSTLIGLGTAGLRGLDKWLHVKDVKTPLDLKVMDQMIK